MPKVAKAAKVPAAGGKKKLAEPVKAAPPPKEVREGREREKGETRRPAGAGMSGASEHGRDPPAAAAPGRGLAAPGRPIQPPQTTPWVFSYPSRPVGGSRPADLWPASA